MIDICKFNENNNSIIMRKSIQELNFFFPLFKENNLIINFNSYIKNIIYIYICTLLILHISYITLIM